MTPNPAASFRAKRTYLGLTQTGMAEAIGVTKSTIVRYEAGDREISRTVWLLVRFLVKAKDGNA